MSEICFICEGYIDPSILQHNCISGLTANINRLHSHFSTLLRAKDAMYWEGFDAAIEMVENLLDNYESNEIAKLSVFEFIEQCRDDLIESVEIYKKDG